VQILQVNMKQTFTVTVIAKPSWWWRIIRPILSGILLILVKLRIITSDAAMSILLPVAEKSLQWRIGDGKWEELDD
jgi:hypothetical protein